MSQGVVARRWRWLLMGSLLGAVFLWLALGHTSWRAVWQAATAAHWAWCLAALVMGGVFMALKTWRWQVLLRPVQHFDMALLHRVVYVGTAANLVVAHSGELLRATWLGRWARRPASPLLTSIGLERIFDFLALVIWALVGAGLAPRAALWLWVGVAVGAALVAIGLCLVWIYLNPGPRHKRVYWRVLRWAPKLAAVWLENQLQRGTQGLQTVRCRRTLLRLALLSVLQWGCIVLAIWACGRAVGADLPAAAAILVFVLMVVGLTLPAPPVQVGATQLAFVVAFEWCGFDAGTGVAASLIYTACVLGWMLLAGTVMGTLGGVQRPPARAAAAPAPVPAERAVPPTARPSLER